MSNSHRNFVIAYILLVGLPILILLGILRLGRTLAAPVSVNGNWKVEAATTPADAHCQSPASFSSNASFVISQSGRLLRVALSGSKSTGVVASGTVASGMIAAGTIADGSIEGKTVKVSIPAARQNSVDPKCGSDQGLTLTATVDPTSEPRALNGILSVDGCADCQPISFRAVRLPRANSDGVR